MEHTDAPSASQATSAPTARPPRPGSQPEAGGPERKGRGRKPRPVTATSPEPVAEALTEPGAGAAHDGGLGSGSELWRCGGDSRPGEQADSRQPGLQSHQAQIAVTCVRAR
ncbi:BET1-like protein isoform X5 [Rhinolophus ferrumequinum]|uniref:BET1-like protein isoform X5 n=1 Tax=Rhinolophus ferrumequinum TaxID=59479 RepID=UPI00140FC74C|nr:BET1-like protein isoform X5 [Rhinolophus ferrumequinum]